MTREAHERFHAPWTTTDPTRAPEADPRWRQDAACRGVDPDLFFPARGEDTEPAKAICRTCPAAGPCLEFALTGPERIGIYGGTSEKERRAMRRARREAAA